MRNYKKNECLFVQNVSLFPKVYYLVKEQTIKINHDYYIYFLLTHLPMFLFV